MLDTRSCQIALDGSVTVETNLLLSGAIGVGGQGVLDFDQGILTLQEIDIHNDFQGVMKKIAEWLGVAPGRQLVINKAACQLMRAALAEPVS